MDFLKARLPALLLWWLWMPVGAFLVWVILRYGLPGMGTWSQWWRLTVVQRMWLPGGSPSHVTGLFWFWVAVGLVGTAVIAATGDGPTTGPRASAFVATVAVIAAIGVLVVPFLRAVWDNDKDEGRYYNRATTWHITDGANPPASLGYLMRGAKQNERGCSYRGGADVRGCVRVDKLSGIATWEGRTSSYASAQQMMAHAASPAPKVDFWEDTLTYLYGAPPKRGGDSGPGIWTAVLDGSGKATPTYGIASWDGASNTVKVACRFAPGDFDRAFHGARGNSLPNWLGEKYSDLLWDDDDVWGYCQGGKPVIVIPVKRQIAFKNRSVMTAAGVLILTGDHGVHAAYRRTVRAGDLPGPAYPESLTVLQREATEWAAGRKWRSRASFGFKPAVDDVQGGNTSEYLLRGPGDHLYYVTPLTPNASRSQAFIAYAVSPADAAADGRLNPMDLYVLPDGDPNVANLNALTNKATDAVRGIDPTFLNTGGRLEEFTPLGGDMWRVYGVRRGLTEFYVDLSITGRISPRTVNVSSTPNSGGKTTPTVSGCGKPPAEMSNKELANCIGALGDELRRRNGSTP
jgi:hypothetical protein